MPLRADELKKMAEYTGRAVEGGYFTTADIISAAMVASIHPKARAVANAIADWYKRKGELEKEGEFISCMCCKKDITGSTVVGGFVIMVPVDVGGFNAPERVDCLVGSVCGQCDIELEHDEKKIMAKAMPGSEPLDIHPSPERSQ